MLLFPALGVSGVPLVRKADYTKADLVKMADVIALVTVTSVGSEALKSRPSIYREIANAKVDSVLKGDLPNDVKLYGGEEFICIQCDEAKGKFLVFLKRDGETLTGWGPIKGDIIPWYKNDESLELESRPLNRVIDEVRALVKQETNSGEQ